jgi:hypothetical protein
MSNRLARPLYTMAPEIPQENAATQASPPQLRSTDSITAAGRLPS